MARASPITRRARAATRWRRGSANPAAARANEDRFIPVRKTDLLDALIEHGLGDGAVANFRLLARLGDAIHHDEYFDRLKRLRDDYFYFNPDLPHDVGVDPAVLARAHDQIAETLVGVPHKADFAEVTGGDVARAHKEHPVLRVAIEIPAEDFREVRLFGRGHHRATAETSQWLGCASARSRSTSTITSC